MQQDATMQATGGHTVYMRVNAEYRKWLDDVCDKERIATPHLIDRALAEYALRHDHPSPPRRVDGPRL